jgi:hypothetical protein
LELSDEFPLPEIRPRQHPRITQLSEWPKILQHLLKNALNERGRLIHPDFSVDDVERAYVETAANMPRNPARRFLADLARSRNVEKLLKPITAAGLTIVEVGENGTYGRFVPKGTEGAIDSRDTLAVSSRDLPLATILRTSSRLPLSNAALGSYLRGRTLGKALFGVGKVVVHGRRNLLGELDGHDMRFEVFSGERRTIHGPVLIARNGGLPTLSQLSAQMTQNGDRASVVLTPITSQHFAAFLVVSNGGRASVRRQGVFRVTTAAAQAPSEINPRTGKRAVASEPAVAIAKRPKSATAGVASRTVSSR